MEPVQPKRISKVEVKSLFGHFNHKIDLRLKDRITIIHGPNGFGKTVLLQMLKTLFSKRYVTLRRLPFDSFLVSFEDGDQIHVKREVTSSEVELTSRKTKRKKNKTQISISYKALNGKTENYLAQNNVAEQIEIPLRYVETEIPELTRIDSGLWQIDPTGEILDIDEVLERFPHAIPHFQREGKLNEPPWFNQIRRSIKIRLIEAQRLITINRQNEQFEYQRPRASGITSSVVTYAKELSQLMQDTLATYATTSQRLDSSFPSRVLLQRPVTTVDQQQLALKLQELELTRQRITSAGLLDKEDQSQLGPQSFDDITKNILALYAQDVETKLGELKDLTGRIELFKKIINQRFSYKKITVDKGSGFHFVSNNLQQLQPTDLSSGEQHELVLFYELLFKTDSGSLILIDEPELSLHVSWQMQFLDDLANIVKLSEFDVILATHSPQIINERWDLTVALRGRRMERVVTINVLCNQIKMLSTNFGGVFLLVEGSEDSRLWKRFLTSNAIVIVCITRENVVGVAVNFQEFPNVIGIIDSDAEFLITNRNYPSNLFLTDKRDIEMSLFNESNLSAILTELAPSEKLKIWESKNGQAYPRILSQAKIIGAFLLVSKRENLGLTFNELKWKGFVDKSSLEIDIVALIEHVKNKSHRHDLVTEDLMRKLKEIYDVINTHHIVRGHDIMGLIAFGLQFAFGSAPSFNTDSVSMVFRLSVTRAQMESLEVFKSLIAWYGNREVPLFV